MHTSRRTVNHYPSVRVYLWTKVTFYFIKKNYFLLSLVGIFFLGAAVKIKFIKEKLFFSILCNLKRLFGVKNFYCECRLRFYMNYKFMKKINLDPLIENKFCAIENNKIFINHRSIFFLFIVFIFFVLCLCYCSDVRHCHQ